MLRQSSALLPIRAARPGLTEFTDSVRKFVVESGIEEGLLTLMRSKNGDILEDIRKTGDLTDATAGKLRTVVDSYARTFA